MTFFFKSLAMTAMAAAATLLVRALPSQHTDPIPTGSSIFEKISDTTGPMMLELYTPYCPSCLKMAPLIDRLARTCTAKGVAVVQYDISAKENEYLADELGIDVVPTFVFIDASGREAFRLVGAQTEDVLELHLADIGGVGCGHRS